MTWKCFWTPNLPSYEVKYGPSKYIDTTERGLVVVSVNEGDAGHYECYLGGSLLCSYSVTVDAHRWVSRSDDEIFPSTATHCSSRVREDAWTCYKYCLFAHTWSMWTSEHLSSLPPNVEFIRRDCNKNNWIFRFFFSFLSRHNRCTAPNKGNDYQKIYSDWCHEFEKYKSAMKMWEKKQAVSCCLIFSFISY